MELQDKLEEIRTALNEQSETKFKDLEQRLEDIATKINTPEFSNEGAKEDKGVTELRTAFFDGIRQRSFTEYDKKAKELIDTRALTGGSTTGGFMVPPDFQSKIITSVSQKNVLRINGDVGRTGSDTVIFGTLEDIAVAWGSTVPKHDVNGSESKADVKKISVIVKIHNDIIDDSEVDLESEVQKLVSKAFVKAERDAMTNTVANAVGALIPAVVAADSGAYAIDTGVDGSFGATDKAIIDYLNESLIFSLDEEDADNAKFMMNRKTLGKLAGVYHPNGAPIYDPVSNKLLGFEVIANASMNNISVAGSTTYPVVFGNFDEYSIRDRKAMTVKVLAELYADESKTGLHFESRVVATVKRADAFRVAEVTTA